MVKMLTLQIQRSLQGALRWRESAQGRTQVEGGPSALNGEGVVAATDGGDVLWVAQCQAEPQSSEKQDTTCWALESLLPCGNKDGSLEWLPSSRLFWTGFLPWALQKSISCRPFPGTSHAPSAKPEAHVQGYFGVWVKPSFTHPVISEPLERDPTRHHLSLAPLRHVFPARAPCAMAALRDLQL